MVRTIRVSVSCRFVPPFTCWNGPTPAGIHSGIRVCGRCAQAVPLPRPTNRAVCKARPYSRRLTNCPNRTVRSRSTHLSDLLRVYVPRSSNEITRNDVYEIIFRLTSIGFTVIVRAESSHVISESCASSALERLCAALILMTPSTIMNSKNPTHTTTMMVTAWDPPEAMMFMWSEDMYSLEMIEAGRTSTLCLLTVAWAMMGSFGWGWITVSCKQVEWGKSADSFRRCRTYSLNVFVGGEAAVQFRTSEFEDPVQVVRRFVVGVDNLTENLLVVVEHVRSWHCHTVFRNTCYHTCNRKTICF